MKQYYVYILASAKNGTLYIGVTNNLLKRFSQHSQKQVSSFTQKYNITTLVYYEVTESIEVAINREKQLKKWNRSWKIALIEQNNPGWIDLSQKF